MKSLFSVPEKNNLIKEVGLQEECASFEYHWGYITQLDSYLEGQLSKQYTRVALKSGRGWYRVGIYKRKLGEVSEPWEEKNN